MWRKFSVKLALLPGWAFELPLREPEFLGRAISRLGVEGAVVRHDALKPIRVAEKPVRHVTAIARA